jgi:hypothetical protein
MSTGILYPQKIPPSTITGSLFVAALNCITKCYLRSQAEKGTGNGYADWFKNHEDSYRKEGLKRLLAGVEHDNSTIYSPGIERLKGSTWKIAVTLVAKAQNLESSVVSHKRLVLCFSVIWALGRKKVLFSRFLAYGIMPVIHETLH